MQTTTTHARYQDLLSRLVRERLIREPERRRITGVSRAHWARLEAAGRAPHRIALSERVVAWRLSDLERWVEIRARGDEWSAPGV